MWAKKNSFQMSIIILNIQGGWSSQRSINNGLYRLCVVYYHGIGFSLSFIIIYNNSSLSIINLMISCWCRATEASATPPMLGQSTIPSSRYISQERPIGYVDQRGFTPPPLRDACLYHYWWIFGKVPNGLWPPPPPPFLGKMLRFFSTKLFGTEMTPPNCRF